MSHARARIGDSCDNTERKYGCGGANQRATRTICNWSEAVAGLLCAMSQRASRISIFASAVGRDHDAYAYPVDHAGQGYEGNHRIFKADALVQRAI